MTNNGWNTLLQGFFKTYNDTNETKNENEKEVHEND